MCELTKASKHLFLLQFICYNSWHQDKEKSNFCLVGNEKFFREGHFFYNKEGYPDSRDLPVFMFTFLRWDINLKYHQELESLMWLYPLSY